MNRKTNIAARIEKNRIALLRMVFCWLAMAFCVSGSRDRVLPPLLAAWVLELISKAEKATSYLLTASFYNSQIKRKRVFNFERAAQKLLRRNASITFGPLTIGGIIKRLKNLQQILLNIDRVARQLAKSVAARVRVTAMQLAAHTMAQPHADIGAPNAALHDDALPP